MGERSVPMTSMLGWASASSMAQTPVFGPLASASAARGCSGKGGERAGGGTCAGADIQDGFDVVGDGDAAVRPVQRDPPGVVLEILRSS